MLTEGLLKQQYIFNDGNSFAVTDNGVIWFNSLGINLDELKKQKRHFAKPCLDWSERKHHLAGALGAALLNRMLTDGWIRRVAESRAITVTRKGEEAFLEHFKTGIR